MHFTWGLYFFHPKKNTGGKFPFHHMFEAIPATIDTFFPLMTRFEQCMKYLQISNSFIFTLSLAYDYKHQQIYMEVDQCI